VGLGGCADCVPRAAVESLFIHWSKPIEEKPRKRARQTLTTISPPSGWRIDCLGRCAYDSRIRLGPYDRVIATLAGQGFASWLRMLLESIRIAGDVADVPVVVLVIDYDPECIEVAQAFNAEVIPVRHVTPLSPGSKAVLYSVCDYIDAERYLCLDSDMVVYGSLRELFEELDGRPERALGMVSDGNMDQPLSQALRRVYRHKPRDLERYRYTPEIAQRINHNDGLMIGTREAFQAIDAKFRTWRMANLWTYGRPGIGCVNQLFLNLAAHQVCDVFSLPDQWNVQLYWNALTWADGVPYFRDKPVRVAHWTGPAKTLRLDDHKLPVPK
jgi:hypothetical protein